MRLPFGKSGKDTRKAPKRQEFKPGKLPKMKKRGKVKNHYSPTPASHVHGLSKPSSGAKKARSRTQRILLSTSSNVLKVFLAVIAFIVFSVVVLYFGVNYVLRLREDTNTTTTFEAGSVEGFENIPAYPGSEFVFDKSIDDETVRKFLGDGYSVYRLPVNKTIDDVYSYYSEKLVALGWKNVMNVNVGSVDMRAGQYWTKEGAGLRVFTKINDIWYQRLVESDAKDGLAKEVAAEKAKQLIIDSANKTSLLPDYPWKLSVPSSYTVKYFTAEFNGLKGIDFVLSGSTDKISLIPYAAYNGQTYSQYITNYTKEKNLRIINSISTQVKGIVCTQSIVTSGEKNGVIIAINNTKNNVVYIIFANNETDPFVAYLKANLEITKWTPN